MKILFINKFFYLKGGAENMFFDTARYLEQKGHKVVFFSMAHPRNVPSPYEKYFVSNIDYEVKGIKNRINASLKLLYSFEARTELERLIREEKPDIAHLHNIYHQISPSVLHSLKKFNIPSILTFRDYKIVCASYLLFYEDKICEACRGKKYYRCFLKSCIKDSYLKSLLNTIEMYLHHNLLHIYDLVDIFISPSRFLKDKVEEMGFTQKIVYLPNFFELRDIKPEYSWSEKSIVYFGRLSREKGLFNLLDAVKKIGQVTLKIIGEGPIEEDIKDKVNQEGIKNVMFLGYKMQEELKDEIKKSMFVVLPSVYYENNPRSIIEGFALGKPAIGSRIGGIPELIKNNERGLTFNPGDSEDLRIKIRYLINNPDKIIEFGKNARAFVEKELNVERHYQRLIKIYTQLIDYKKCRH